MRSRLKSAAATIVVFKIDEGFPAYGVLEVDDVILGADGTGAVQVPLSKGSEKWPLVPIAEAEARNPALLKEEKGDSAGFSVLCLLAAAHPDDPRHDAMMAKAKEWAHGLEDGGSPWYLGPKLVALSEYYMQSKDQNILSKLEALAETSLIITRKRLSILMKPFFAPPLTLALITTLLLAAAAPNTLAETEPSETQLQALFQNPPDDFRPLCYWYWVGGQVTREGVTKDLEAMAQAGIGGAMIGNIGTGIQRMVVPVSVFSDEWYALTRHALSEAQRLGIKIYFFNSAGWSQSGGPWVKPEQSMRMVVWDEQTTQGGPVQIDFAPNDVARDQVIAVLAVPHQQHTVLEGQSEKDGTRFSSPEPITARSLQIFGTYQGKLYAVKDGQEALIAELNAQEGGGKDFTPKAADTFSFADTTAREFVLKPAVKGKAQLSTQALIAQVVEKQLGRLADRRDIRWDSYLFPATAQPENGQGVMGRESIIDLSDQLDDRGRLQATLPAGSWDILRFRMQTTGMQNHPAPKEAKGLEVDKMNRRHVRHHLDSMFGRLLAEATPQEKAAWVGLNIDSYEQGPQNWTEGFDTVFAERNGYDPLRMLPTLTGRIVESAEASDQFLWDLRRTVADLIAEEYIGELTRFAHEHEMVTWVENYGPWGFPGEFTNYGGYADQIGGTFWVKEIVLEPDYLSTLASSTAHTYGKRRVYAEAFTQMKTNFGDHPYSLKARGEQSFARGVNHFVLHVFISQPVDGIPGLNKWGVHFHRNTPWFSQTREWVRYLQRCHLMLQQGNPGVDVTVYIGDFAPQMNGPQNPVPEGYDFSYIGSDAILRKLDVVDGQWVVYDEKDPKRIAARYRFLLIPENIGYVRPNVQARLGALQKKGGAVIHDAQVTEEKLTAVGLRPWISQASTTIKWEARESSDRSIYFISNFGKAGPFEATLRTQTGQPVLYDPVTGQSYRLAHYKNTPEGTRIHLPIRDPAESYFIVFDKTPSKLSVENVEGEGREQLSLTLDADGTVVAESAQAGNFTLTMSDGSKRPLVIEEPTAPVLIKTIGAPWKKETVDPDGYVASFASTFQLPEAYPVNERVYLDLGDTGVMATITLNGHSFPTDWMPPYRVDVTDYLKTGPNEVSILIANTSEGPAQLGEKVQLQATVAKILGDQTNID